jgi:hypothetical protein
MAIYSDKPEHGFRFPGECELTTMGPAPAGGGGAPEPAAYTGIAVIEETLCTPATAAENTSR